MLAVICALVPWMHGCSAFRENVTAIPRLRTAARRYTGEMVVTTGRVEQLHEWSYPDGYRSEVFMLCDDGNGCIHVYAKQHSRIQDGSIVTVRGPFYDSFKTHTAQYRNEIEAVDVFPR